MVHEQWSMDSRDDGLWTMDSMDYGSESMDIDQWDTLNGIISIDHGLLSMVHGQSSVINDPCFPWYMKGLEG